MSIFSAVANNSYRIVELMVSVPGNVKTEDIDRSLLLAAKKGYIECVTHLIKAGANLDTQDLGGNTPLKLAAENGHIGTIQILIESNCEVNAWNNAGSTVLHYAARWGHVQCVQILISNGAKIDSQDVKKQTPLILAAKNIRQHVMRLLITKGCNVNSEDSDGRTALHYAAQRAFGVEQLLQAGANPDIQDINGLTPTILAATEGFSNIISLLIKAKCNVNLAQTSQSRTPIHYMAMKGHTECVRELLHAGADHDMPDIDGHTPLWHAINYNRTETVKLLLRANCGLNEYSDINHSPLKLAIERGNTEIIKMVLLAGCETASFRMWLSSGMIREYHFNNSDLLQWLYNLTHSMHTLKWHCRKRIRETLGHNVIHGLDVLNIPDSIKEYISLKELDDCQ